MNPPKKNRIDFFYKRLVFVVAINFLPLLVLFGLLYSNVVGDYKNNLIALMRNQVILLASASESALLFEDNEAGDRLLSTLELNPAIRYAQIYNDDMQLFVEYKSDEEIVDALVGDFHEDVFFKNGNIYLNYKVVKNGEYLGLIVLSANTDALATQKKNLFLVSFLMLFGSFVLASLLNWKLQQRLNAPIRALTGLVSYISKSKRYHRRLEIDQNNEFDELIAGVNAMLSTIELHEGERKEAAAQIIQASKLATLGEMATSVAHELNQPLNVIRIAVRNSHRKLADGTADPEYLSSKLERIQEQTTRASAIIDHMRMFGRKAEESPESVDPRKVVMNALDLMGEPLRLAGIEVVTELAEGCPSILGHPIQLEQVILNLLSNSRDAIGERDGQAKITLRVFFDDKGVHITSEDTGGGIPEGALPRIFEPFYTTKEMGKGTGLGLSVGYGIIRDMDGSIDAENIDDGARFTITLPCDS